MGEAAFPQWLFLLRGAEPVIVMLDPHSYKGPLAPLFAHGAHRMMVHTKYSPDDTQPTLLAELQRLIEKGCTEPELLPTYNSAIDHLRRILGMVLPAGAGRGGGSGSGSDNNNNNNNSPQMGAGAGSAESAPSLGHKRPINQRPVLDADDVFVWQWCVANDLLPLLKGSDVRQEAVVIFAHFLILLKKLENQWWLEGWASHLMGQAWASLDQEHRLWIQWPIEELGWVPP